MITCNALISNLAYPDYCSKIGLFEDQRKSAAAINTVVNEMLKPFQILTILRHGARAPIGDVDKCWPDYSSEWNCDLVEVYRAYAPEIKSDDKNEVVKIQERKNRRLHIVDMLNNHLNPKLDDSKSKRKGFNNCNNNGQMTSSEQSKIMTASQLDNEAKKVMKPAVKAAERTRTEKRDPIQSLEFGIRMEEKSGNSLGGTCGEGFLLREGYDQHK